ncbi:MAG: enoyl-CoA hydratase-related protein [Acidimicrobiales bacterium]
MDEGVAVITLDRPEVRNAFGATMAGELADAYRRSDGDDGVRVVVLTGTPPAFCAGADLSAGADTFARRDEATFSAAAVPVPAWELRKLVIAAVNGHAVGIGLTLTLQCDIRIFAADATYGIVQVRRGVMGDGYSHWTLPRIVGHSAAAEILLAGRTFDGHRARDLGLCSQVLPNDDVLPAALELARDVAVNAAPLSVALSKKLLWQSWDLTLAQTEGYETALHHHLMGGPDAREGVAAYLERRAPVWRGSPSSDMPEWPEVGRSDGREVPGAPSARR